MPLDLARTPTKDILPPRLVIYGPPKIGKTTLASKIPNNILLDYEGGSGNVNIARLKKDEVDTYAKTMEAFRALYEDKHEFTSITIDTVDWLENVVNDEVCRLAQVKTISDIPYGGGTVAAQNTFKTDILEALDALRKDRGMMVVLLAHESIRRYDNPTTESYDRYTLKLQENNKGIGICSLIKEWADAILFANQETFVSKEKIAPKKEVKKAKTSSNIVLHTQESPAFLAGNRYNLPAQLPFTWEALSEALTNALA